MKHYYYYSFFIITSCHMETQHSLKAHCGASEQFRLDDGTPGVSVLADFSASVSLN